MESDDYPKNKIFTMLTIMTFISANQSLIFVDFTGSGQEFRVYFVG